MPVHTHTEIEEKNRRDSHHNSSAVIRDRKEFQEKTYPPPPTPEIPSTLFILAYPEIEVGLLKNFEDMVMIDGVKYRRKCVNGAVRTTEEKLKDYLLNQGYLLIDTIKGENHG